MAKSKMTARVNEVMQLMIEENSNNRPITVNAIADILQKKDGVALGNATYKKAKEAFDRMSTHPCLTDDELMISIGVFAATKLLESLPTANTSMEIMEAAVKHERDATRRLKVVVEKTKNLNVVTSDLSKVRDMLVENGAVNASQVIERAMQSIDDARALIEKELEFREVGYASHAC